MVWIQRVLHSNIHERESGHGGVGEEQDMLHQKWRNGCLIFGETVQS